MPMSWSEFQKGRSVSGKPDAIPKALEAFFEACPLLAAFLGRYVNEQGTVVSKQGSVTLFVDGGRLKACLNDHYLNAKGFMTLEDFTDPLTVLDLKMQRGEVEWQRDKRRT